MPRFDGTGPHGKGPKTGRGIGKCRGKGCEGCPFYVQNSTPNADAEHEELKYEIESLRNEIQRLKDKLSNG